MILQLTQFICNLGSFIFSILCTRHGHEILFIIITSYTFHVVKIVRVENDPWIISRFTDIWYRTIWLPKLYSVDNVSVMSCSYLSTCFISILRSRSKPFLWLFRFNHFFKCIFWRYFNTNSLKQNTCTFDLPMLYY